MSDCKVVLFSVRFMGCKSCKSMGRGTKQISSVQSVFVTQPSLYLACSFDAIYLLSYFGNLLCAIFKHVSRARQEGVKIGLITIKFIDFGEGKSMEII